MAFSLEEIQEEVISLLTSSFAQPVIEQGIPDIDTVRRNAQGAIDPYIAFSFGQARERGAKSFAGPWGDDYHLPIYIQVVAPTPKVARQLGNKVTRVFLGQSFEWAGSVRQMSGGPVLPITESNAGTEAFMLPMSFGLLVQIHVSGS